jgi:hypothetical protein
MGELDLDIIEQVVSCAESRKNNPEHECSFCRRVLLRNDEMPYGLANSDTFSNKKIPVLAY